MESVVKCQDLQTVVPVMVPEPGFLLHMSNSRAQNHIVNIIIKLSQENFGFQVEPSNKISLDYVNCSD